MKKRTLGLFICIMLTACSQAPGAKETGYKGTAWGSDAESVSKALDVTPSLTTANSLFSSYYHATKPRLGTLMAEGFAKFLTGKADAKFDGLNALKGMTMLDAGTNGYSLFFHGKFGMNLRPIPASEFDTFHKKLMKRYGVIDKKVDYIPNEYESAYFIMWHNADGKILLAKETYKTGPDHVATAAQLIHMDKHVFDAITSELKAAK